MATTLASPPLPEVTAGPSNGPPPGALLRPLQPVAGLPPGAFLRQVGPRLAAPAPSTPTPSVTPASAPQSARQQMRQGSSEGWMPGSGYAAQNKPFFDWLNTPITAGESPEQLSPSAQRFSDKWKEFKSAHPAVAGVLDPVSAEADWEKLHPNVAGAHEAVNDFGHSMETPKNLAMLAAMPAYRPLSAFFAAQSAHGAYQSAEQAFEAFRDGKNAQAAKYATEAGLNALMGLVAGSHAARGGGHAATERPEALQAGEKLTTDVAKSDKVSGSENSDVVPRGTEAHPPIGETEPETGRPVLQQSPRPEVNQAAATAEHPAIKDALHEITQPIEGAEVAGARAEKDEDRLDDKIDDGQSPRTVRDYSGFRIAVDSPEARDQVVSALKSKFEVPNETDEFEAGHPENGFHGHTLQVREPGSPVTHEVQILPREVADAAEERHPLYEKAREGDQAAQAELKAANQADYQKFVERTTNEKGAADERVNRPQEAGAPTNQKAASAEPVFKSGSTQANIDPNSEAAAALKTAREKIAPEDRAGNVNGTEGGIETQPHVTVRYGLKGDDHGQVRKFIASQAPFEATLGPTDKFPASENSDGAVPIISHIDAPELHRINGEIEQYGDFEKSDFPDYKPHATLGYVKPEAAEKYTGMRDTEGKKFTVRSIAISDRNGNLEEIPLRGSKAEGNSQQSEGNSGRLSAPRPPERGGKTGRWEKGEHFLVRDPATGDFRTGEVTYFNEGSQPQAKAGGRSRLSDGTRLDEIPRDAMRIQLSAKPIDPVAGTDFERDVIARVKTNLPKLVGHYLERFTEGGIPTLATDAAKELIPEFKADPTGTDRETAAGGKAIRDSALATVLSSPVDPKRPDVLITTASPGSGKTTGQAAANPERVGAKIEAIADDFKSFRGLVKQVIDSGRKPVIEWVYVDDPAKTVRRMFLRAVGHGERPGIGRTVQLKYMADAYTQVPRVIERIREEFGDKVQIHAVDNSGPLGTAKVTSDIDPLIESIKSKPYNQVVEGMADETRKLQSEGHFQSARGKAILEAAQANDPTRSDEAAGGSGKVPDVLGSGGRESQGPEAPGPLLDTQPKEAVNNATGGRRAPAGSVLFERLKEAARERARRGKEKVSL